MKKLRYCDHCRKETHYSIEKRDYDAIIEGENYTFKVSQAVCDECGRNVYPQELIPKKIQEIKEGYRNSL